MQLLEPEPVPAVHTGVPLVVLKTEWQHQEVRELVPFLLDVVDFLTGRQIARSQLLHPVDGGTPQHHADNAAQAPHTGQVQLGKDAGHHATRLN